jgi:hypothetical protein
VTPKGDPLGACRPRSLQRHGGRTLNRLSGRCVIIMVFDVVVLQLLDNRGLERQPRLRGCQDMTDSSKPQLSREASWTLQRSQEIQQILLFLTAQPLIETNHLVRIRPAAFMLLNCFD